MRLPAAKLDASAPVPRVPVRAPVFHVLVLVQVEVSVKHEFPAKNVTTAAGPSGALHLPRGGQVCWYVASAAHPT